MSGPKSGKHMSVTGSCYWYRNGVYHRDDGPAIVYHNGTKVWYQDGLEHRLDGPAYEGQNSREWYRNGLLHRLDGPAIEYDNNFIKEWYFEGARIDCNSQEEFERIIKLKAFW